MNSVSTEIWAKVDDLQARYVHALDNRDFASWVDTFSTDPSASYFCISAENENNDLPIALMYDDCRDRIEDRVVFIEKIWAGTFQDYRTRHFVQRTHCRNNANKLYDVETNFSILYTPENGRTTVQVVGVYKDTVTMNDGNAKFLSKKAIYDTTILPRYIVYPF